MVHLKPKQVIDIPVKDFYSFVFGEMPEEHLPRVAYFDGITGDSITFGQLKTDVLAFARGLRDPASPWGGLKRHQIACIFGSNSILIPTLVFGLLKSGGGLSPSNPNYTPRELAHQIKASNSVLLVAHSSMLANAIAGAEQAGLSRNRIILMDDAPDKGFPTVPQIIKRGYQLTDADVGGEIVFTAHDIQKVPVLIPFSSGTTGLPKGVQLTHYGLVSNVIMKSTCEDSFKDPPFEGVDTRVCFIPLFHMAGVMLFLCQAPKAGAGVCVFPRFDPQLVLKAWEKYRVRRVLVVPPVAVVLSKMDTSGYDLSSVKYVECGSAPLGVEVEEIISKKFGVPVHQVWGMSEATCYLTAYWGDSKYKRAGVGEPLPNVEVKIVNPETGELVGRNKPGEAWARSPSLALGYIGLPEQTKESFTDGWYHTGDMLVCDDDGMLFVVDRIKELIKTNAFQIAPAELEDLIMTHADVADVCVVGIPDEAAGEVPRAFIALKSGINPSNSKATEIREFMDKLVVPYKRLRGGIEFREVIPRGATGKLLRRELRDEVRKQMAAAGKSKL